MIQIKTLREEHLAEAAALFTDKLAKLRQEVPILPGRLQDPALVARLLGGRPGLAAFEGRRLVGYLAWFEVPHFRGTDRLGAYIPEWGHGVLAGEGRKLYPALYRAASSLWSEAGCQVHAITLLANDGAAENTWYWNGFGLAVIDAVRPLLALDPPVRTSLAIRQAHEADLEALAGLDKEHWQHYTKSPIFMAPHQPKGVDAWREFLSHPLNSVWLACEGEQPVGFMVFDQSEFDAVEMLNDESLIGISGAFIRPEYRGQKAAPALLEAALQEYAKLELQVCGVNFESFNPEAAAFWPRYFTLVCHSLMRVPET